MVKSVKGKRGVSLVEEVCAVAILAIVVVGLIFVIGFSQTSIVSYNSHDKAAAKVQEVSDRVMAVLAQCPDANGGNNGSVPQDILKETGICIWPYNGTIPTYSYDKTYYSYKRVTNDGAVAGKQMIGYDITVTRYYSKTNYVAYNAYVSYTGKDV